MKIIYLCEEHFKSLPGIVEEWTPAIIGTEKCVVCGHNAKHEVSEIVLFGEALLRYIICVNNSNNKEKI